MDGKKGTTYADAGVNIELGDDVSKILYNAAKQTWQNREGRLGEVIEPFEDFSGVRAIDVSGLPEGTLMNINFDGVGTKMELAERLNNHRTIAFDLFAMVCDDAVVRGAEPVLVGSILDVNSLGTKEKPYTEQVMQLAQGYIDAAKAANVAVVNGEVAELGSRIGGYGPFNYNWGAAVVWFARKDRLITGNEVQEGDQIVGLKEEGFRSNGLSLARKVMEGQFGPENWHFELYHGELPDDAVRTHSGVNCVGEAVLAPSKIYTKAIVEMTGGYEGEPLAEVHGVAHITGGGLPGKLGRALKPSGLGADIPNPFQVPDIMKFCQKYGVSDDEAYRTWNMGQGIVIITPEPEKVMGVAKRNNIGAKTIGEITTEPGIKIQSAGYQNPGEYLTFAVEV